MRILIASLVLSACGEEDAVDLSALEALEQTAVPVCPSTATRLVKAYYVNCYQDEWLVPRWVGYRIAAPELVGPAEVRSSFRSDPALPLSARSDNNDYEVYFDRGQVAPAEDFLRSELAMDESLLLSNVAPREPIFNREPWTELEAAVRGTVRGVQVAWIYTGNLFLDANGQPNEPAVRIGRHGIAVPTHNWKAVLARSSDGTHQAYGYILPNVYPPPFAWRTFNVPVDQVEGLTGLDLFAALPDQVESVIEASANPLPSSP